MKRLLVAVCALACAALCVSGAEARMKIVNAPFHFTGTVANPGNPTNGSDSTLVSARPGQGQVSVATSDTTNWISLQDAVINSPEWINRSAAPTDSTTMPYTLAFRVLFQAVSDVNGGLGANADSIEVSVQTSQDGNTVDAALISTAIGRLTYNVTAPATKGISFYTLPKMPAGLYGTYTAANLTNLAGLPFVRFIVSKWDVTSTLGSKWKCDIAYLTPDPN